MKVLLTIPGKQGAPRDETVAEEEGWGVFDCGLRRDGTREMQLQRLDCPRDGNPRFKDDKAAWRHVTDCARAGSELHRTALAAVDPAERALIEAACGAW